MLRSLHIQNYALIDDLTIDFGPGLSALTGETGAGKSIIIGALSLILGEKPDPDSIRTGRDSAVVEAVFESGPEGDFAGDASSVRGILADVGLEESCNEQLVVRRKVARDGRHQVLLNDHPIAVGTLKRLGDALVDLHGQHEHQSLLNVDLHLEVLDDFAGLTGSRHELGECFRRYRSLEAELRRLREEVRARQERRDLTEFQLNELKTVLARPDDLERLRTEKDRVETAEKRLTLVRELLELLVESEGSAQEQLGAAGRRLEALVQLDPGLSATLDEIRQAAAQTDETARALLKYRDTIDLLPGRLDEINERLFRVEQLVRKYLPQAKGLDASAVAGLLALRDRLAGEIAAQDVDETNAESLERELASLKSELGDLARRLSQGRAKAARRLEARLSRELAGLGLIDARVPVHLALSPDPDGIYAAGSRKFRLDETGVDAVEFMFSANPGEEPRPLRKIASGGELSRIMLALKGVLSADRQVPVMIFDEIDSGIGGRVAEKVGRRLVRIAAGRQVICVTHLAQIAKFAETHLRVTKETRAGRTLTRIQALSRPERIDEIARMLAGTEVTRTALAHAQELLEQRPGAGG